MSALAGLKEFLYPTKKKTLFALVSVGVVFILPWLVLSNLLPDFPDLYWPLVLSYLLIFYVLGCFLSARKSGARFMMFSLILVVGLLVLSEVFPGNIGYGGVYLSPGYLESVCARITPIAERIVYVGLYAAFALILFLAYVLSWNKGRRKSEKSSGVVKQ